MASEGGSLVYTLPLDLPCTPCLDIECSLPGIEEVWLLLRGFSRVNIVPADNDHVLD